MRGGLLWASGAFAAAFWKSGRTARELNAAKDEAERQAVRLQLLADISRELLLHHQPQDLLETVFERVSAHLGLEVYFHFQTRPEGDHLVLASSRGIPAEALPDLQRLDYGQAVCGTVAAERRPFAIENVQESEDEKTELIRSFGITAYACHPLLADGRLLGTLSFGTRQRPSFQDDELELMRTLCDQLAAALERSRLIDELRRRTREAQEARAAAEAASSTKDEFLATLSHELRTPLTPVLLTAHTLLSDPRIPAELHPDLDRLHRNVELEARLIDDLLDLTRVARGKIQLELETVDVHALVQQAAETCCTRLPRPAPPISMELGATASWVWGDAARLRQVVWNLLSNAIKFTGPDGWVVVRTSDGPDGELVLEVVDTGLGIDPASLPHIFNAFEQGGSQITRRFGGLGLGLAICKSLVELHGGAIAVSSDGLGHGAAFTLRLPAVPAPQASPKPLAASGAEARRPLHILLVEDHVDTSEALAELLRARGHRVTTASSLARAKEEVRNAGAIDLVVSDLGLPDGSGLDLFRELAPRGVRGIAFSGYGTEEDVRKSREAGFSLHLTKPVSVQALENAIREVTRQPAGSPS